MDNAQLEPESSANSLTAAALWNTGSGNCIEVSYDPELWPEKTMGHFAQISTKLLDHINVEFALDGVFVGLLLCGDDRIRRLNKQFCGKDWATNVLSFPQLDDVFFGDDASAAAHQIDQQFIGEIAIARETIMAQAAELGIGIDDHLAHLFVHGLMHLLGFDHENDQEATEMESLEISILAAVSVANPYLIADRVAHHGVMK